MHSGLEDLMDTDYDFEPDSSGISQDVVKKSLLPTVQDPNLWILRCKAGFELHISMLLMNKYIAAKKTDDVINSFRKNNILFIKNKTYN